MGAIRREAGRGGLERVVVETAAAEAEIYLLGGNVTRFRPRDQESSLLWLSENSKFEPGKAIRGGIPICWPWFGPLPGSPSAPQHGFARTSAFTLLDAMEAGDEATIVLELAPAEERSGHFGHEYLLRYTVVVGRALTVELTVMNTGAAPFLYEEALHTYLAVGDVAEARVVGLAGTSYLDKVDGGRQKMELEGALALTGETDRVYLDTEASCALIDPRLARQVCIDKIGSATTVVWNPWADKSRAMADMGADAWRTMICIETANAGAAARELAPGASHAMAARISASGT